MTKIKERLLAFVESKKERHFDPRVTYSQLHSDKIVVWSWGAKYFNFIEDYGLSFEVNGRLHKGFVVITLGFMDTYNIYLLDKEANQVGGSVEGIYADSLNQDIDYLVETPVHL
jgi:hypothetical protein